MSHVFHQCYYHLAWGTHDRHPVVTRAIRPEVLRIMAEEVAKREGILLRQNAMPNILVSDFIGQVKGGLSYRIKHELKPDHPIRWQEGYGVLTLREGDVSTVSRYIDRQEELHARRKLSKVLEILLED